MGRVKVTDFHPCISLIANMGQYLWRIKSIPKEYVLNLRMLPMFGDEWSSHRTEFSECWGGNSSEQSATLVLFVHWNKSSFPYSGRDKIVYLA
ncbi:hypothetical protein Ancab_036293 [Ancistrocladus abbreviatus]